MAVNPEDFYNGDGSRVLFPFTFEYLEESDVKVSVDGTVKTQTTDYTFANATTISFNTAPASGTDNVRIYRDTNVDELKATFFPGSAIRADDLNDNLTQNNYAVQEIKAYYWDNETDTIHSNETWVSSDTQIATTAAMDQRFLDEADEIIKSTDTWVSDDDRVASTAAIDNRVDSKIDTAIEGDILIDATGLSKSAAGGQVTLGIAAGSVDLDRIKAEDIITSAEVNPNNDSTIATTAKIDDMIDAAITGDIAVDSTGLTLTDDGDGTITLGIGAGSVDLDRIKAGDIINLAEQDAGPTTADTSIFTSSAAAKRFDTLVQTATPSGSDYQVGKTWLQNDDDLTLSIWNGSGWTAITSGGTFTEQPSVVYVDQASGDDNNTGHRISTPKATIKGAIDQINAEIDTEITSGGSGYVEGSYSTVALTGGNGTGLTADITVNASGVVTAVTVNSAATLEDYSIGDVLSASNTDLGGSGSGLQITVTGDGDGQIVIVSAGAYPEVAPIQIKRRNVSIIGQSLRSCIVHPTSATETNTLFELNSGSYISNLTLTGVKAGTGTGNTLDATLPTTQGWNFAFYEDAFITKSPYIQNCTNFSDSEIENNPASANYLIHNPAGGQAGDTDSDPTGGGLLVNGATPHDDSPLRSMVADSYTHVALNGPGILVVNNGYTQITSSYAFFNKYHIKCLTGGQANLAASTTDFGTQALVADGRSTTAIFSGTVQSNASAGATVFRVHNLSADASWHGSATRPQSNMLVEVNGDVYPIISATLHGASSWDVEISNPDPTNRSNNLGLISAVSSSDDVDFFLRSQIASSGHTMEYVGSGTDYTALPENGGVPIEANQVVESNNGKIWTATTDHNGKFKVGDFFEVDQQLGFVTIPNGSIAFDLASDPTPELAANLDANSNRITDLADPTAAQDAATKNYVDTELAGLSANSISAGDSNITVTDTGVGIISMNVDGNIILAADSTQIIPDVNVKFADNVKATFGTGGDLEIYHDGSNSIIDDVGTGNLQFKVAGSTKLETTSTGIDVTGTVTCDGLTSDGTATIQSGTGTVVIKDTDSDGDASKTLVEFRQSDDALQGRVGYITTGNDDLYVYNSRAANLVFGTANNDRVLIDGVGNLRPSVDSTYDLGVTGTRWRNVYADTLYGDGSNLTGIQAGATGGGSDDVFYENGQTVTTNYTITTNKHAMSAGPITINSGVTVTIPTGSNWVIV